MSDKLLRALRKLDPAGGLDEVGAKTLSDGLRSEALPVVEAALAVCAAARGAGGTAAPLAHAWPRAPAAALPLMAAALVEVALQTADSGMLLRLTPSRADGGVGTPMGARRQVAAARPEPAGLPNGGEPRRDCDATGGCVGGNVRDVQVAASGACGGAAA